MSPENVERIAATITDPWKPVVAAEANGFEMKVAKLDGDFPWHRHDAEDELFYCVSGSFALEMREPVEAVQMQPGDVFVVPRGREHRPVAEREAVAVLFEPAETKQYGD